MSREYYIAGTGLEGKRRSLSDEPRDRSAAIERLRREKRIAKMFGGTILGYIDKLTLDDIDEEFRGGLIFRELEGEPYKLRQLQAYIEEEVVPSSTDPYEATAYSQLEYFIRKYTEYEELAEDTRILSVSSSFGTKSREILPAASKKEIQTLLARTLRHELVMSAHDDASSEARRGRIDAMLECVDDNDSLLDVIDTCYENGDAQLGNEISGRLEDKLEANQSEYWLTGLYAAQLKHGIDVYRNIDSINALLGGDISGIAESESTNRSRLIAEGLSRNLKDHNVKAMLERVRNSDERSYYFVMSTLPYEQLDSVTRRKLRGHVKAVAKRLSGRGKYAYRTMSTQVRGEILDTLTRYMKSGLGESALRPLATFVESTDYVVEKANKATVAALMSNDRHHDGLLTRDDDEFAEEYLSRAGVHPKVRKHYSVQRLDGIEKETRKGSLRTHRFYPSLPYVGIMKAAIKQGKNAEVLAAYNWLDQHNVLQRNEIFEIAFSISENGIAEAKETAEEEISLIKAKLEVLDLHLSSLNLTNGTVEKKKASNILVHDTEDSIKRAAEITSAGHRFIALSAIADLYINYSVTIPPELKNLLSETARWIRNTDKARRSITVEDVRQVLKEYKSSGLW